jgi:hypothetical protein
MRKEWSWLHLGFLPDINNRLNRGNTVETSEKYSLAFSSVFEPGVSGMRSRSPDLFNHEFLYCVEQLLIKQH